MKRRLFLIVMLVVFFIASLSAGAEFYLRPNFLVSYDTNVFSDPLPKYEENTYEERQFTGFLKRTGLGLFLDMDVFFSESGRTGLSVSFLYGHPISTEAWVVEGEKKLPTGNNAEEKINAIPIKDGTWVLDSTEPSLYFAIGPMFRGKLGGVDIGIAVRASAGSVNLFKDSVNLGLQIEPYIMVPLGSDHWKLSAGLLYDAHFFDFLLNSKDKIYRDDYFLLTLGGYVGITYRWGN